MPGQNKPKRKRQKPIVGSLAKKKPAKKKKIYISGAKKGKYTYTTNPKKNIMPSTKKKTVRRKRRA